MEMFLTAACMGLFALALSGLAFRASTLPEDPPAAEKPQPEPVRSYVRPRFFTDSIVIPNAAHSEVPIEALLLQIENHVRLEQAAAESFVSSPTADLLHCRTVSTLIQ
jgi:hypothetical protein